MKKLLVDSLNGERIQEIMKLHGENLNRNGEEFRRLSIKKMRQLLISGRKLTDKDAPEDMYLKITFGDWLGKKYTYATDGTTIVSL